MVCSISRVLLLKWWWGLFIVWTMFSLRLSLLLKGLRRLWCGRQVTVPMAKLWWVRLRWMLAIKWILLGRWWLEQVFLMWQAAALIGSLLIMVAMALRAIFAWRILTFVVCSMCLARL